MKRKHKLRNCFSSLDTPKNRWDFIDNIRRQIKKSANITTTAQDGILYYFPPYCLHIKENGSSSRMGAFFTRCVLIEFTMFVHLSENFIHQIAANLPLNATEKSENMTKKEYIEKKLSSYLFNSLFYKNGKAQKMPVVAGRLL